MVAVPGAFPAAAKGRLADALAETGFLSIAVHAHECIACTIAGQLRWHRAHSD